MSNSTAIYAPTQTVTMNPLDLYHEIKAKNLEKSRAGMVLSSVEVPELQGTNLDITNWLPAAAGGYQISQDIQDYILVPVIAVPSDLPNRNTVGFPLSELISFNHELGQLSYKTWKGKPTFKEHANTDITKAKGVIADTFFRKLEGYGGGKVYKLVLLLCFDRTKDPELCEDILKKKVNSYSMGAMVSSYYCSYCGADLGKCTHLRGRSPQLSIVNGHLVNKMCRGIVGFETSAVQSPAWVQALSDTRINVSTEGVARYDD